MNMKQSNFMSDFLDQYLAYSYFDSYSSSEKSKMKNELLDSFEGEINSMIIGSLPDNLLDEYKDSLEAGGEVLDNFLLTKVPNFSESVELLTQSFVKILLQNVDKE